MQTPETRVVRQCTYTPIEPSPEDPPTVQPFALQAILATAFDEPEMTKAVLERMELLRPEHPEPLHETLIGVVKGMWDGDVRASIEALRELDVHDVGQFARTALHVERTALEQAQRDLTRAATAVATRTEARVDETDEVSRRVAAIRESIVAEMRDLIEARVAGVTRGIPVPLAPGVRTGVGMAGPAESAPVAEALHEASVRTDISLEMIRSELSATMPQSATFLEKIGYLTAPVTLTHTAPAQLLALQLAHNTLKSQVLDNLLENTRVEPVGYLHLERLQFTPVGYEKGELVYSLPMLPDETVRLTHREWSRTETEYTKLVATELETASEQAISEKSELAQSASTQQQHTSAYNTSVSSGYSGGGFSISASFGYNCSNSETASRQFAARTAQEITKRASTRAKKDSKITFKVATAYELEDQQYREISNSLRRSVRYDFHRLMKKWQVDLYRYDIRLTYDIVIPEPASYLLRAYVLLRDIDKELAQPNPFHLSPMHIVREPATGDLSEVQKAAGLTTWVALAHRYDVSPRRRPKSTRG
jgi:hypothetical protein